MNTYEYVYREIGDKIRKLRTSKNLTQDALASLVGLTRTSIVHIEKGRQKAPLDKLYQIADLLEVGVIDLLPPMRNLDNRSEQVDIETRKRIGEEELGRILSAITNKGEEEHDTTK